MKPTHIPVLVEEVIQMLAPKRGDVYFDATAGYGGHAAAIAEAGPGRMILSDRDSSAVAALEERFPQAEVWHLAMSEAAQRLLGAGIRPDLILVDLGVSSPQLDESQRGFSFNNQGPIDMRMDQSQDLSAQQIVNDYTPTKLADIIGRYGEEHRAKTVARAIVAARPITNTKQLADVVRSVVPRSGHIDPATRTFQAIRMEVNDELGELEGSLPLLTQALAPGGRMAVISFHSLEDRLVKQWFERESRGCICDPKQPVCTCDHLATLAKLTPKPLTDLTSTNPRARSAKLRVACKLTPKPKEAN